MSVLRPLLSRRGRLVFAAVALLLMGALVAAPSMSGATEEAGVKQFTASITPGTATGGVPGTWTERVTNCGAPAVSPCTAASTIGLGRIRITVPTQFRPVTVVSVVTSPSTRNWVASYNSAAGTINARAVTGSNKLRAGEFVEVGFSSTPTATTACGVPATFTTAAWGSVSESEDVFQIKTAQPTVAVSNQGCLESGGSITGPGGQTETINGDFQGHVLVTFGGDLDCSFDPTFGAQWSLFHLPTQVNIIPDADFVAGSSPKISTSRFPAAGADSSSYLICYAVPTAGHSAFATRGGGPATMQNIGGTDFFVGILPDCYNPAAGTTRPEPCVSEQFLDLATGEIVISVRMLPGDPHKR